MPDLHTKDELSFGDALFLHLEREGMPLHVASLTTFEGCISLQECTQYIEAKLPLIPRYWQRVAPAPFNLGLPRWQFDGKFDIRNHVREVRLKRGTDVELKAAAARILSSCMDRSRPLWDLTLLQGLRGDRTGVLVRVHHCMADGLSGVGLLNVLLDAVPLDSPPPVRKKRAAIASRRPERSVLDTLVDSCFSIVQRVVTAESELLEMAQRVLAVAERQVRAEASSSPTLDSSDPAAIAEQFERVLPEILAPAERLPFNQVCRGPQRFEGAEIPLSELKTAKHLCGVSLNDVVLGLVTSAVRRYARLHGVPVRGRSLRIVVPVSVRGKEQMGDLGNRITFVPVAVPLDIRRIRNTVAAVHERVSVLKSAHIGELVGFAGTLLGTIPAPLQAAIGPIASQLPLSVCNLICTNVPGPKMPLYLLRHKMLSCTPYVPIGGEMGMNCALLTYNGMAYFGFTGDIHAVPDLEQFPKFLLESFAELRKQIGMTRASRKRKPSQPKARAAAEQGAVREGLIDFPRKPTASPGAAVESEKAFKAAIGA